SCSAVVVKRVCNVQASCGTVVMGSPFRQPGLLTQPILRERLPFGTDWLDTHGGGGMLPLIQPRQASLSTGSWTSPGSWGDAFDQRAFSSDDSLRSIPRMQARPGRRRRGLTPFQGSQAGLQLLQFPGQLLVPGLAGLHLLFQKPGPVFQGGDRGLA